MGASSIQDRSFRCPSDTFCYTPGDIPEYHAESSFEYYQPVYSSYIYNGANTALEPRPGIAGLRITSIIRPARTDALTELSASWPWSWHEPRKMDPGAWGTKDAENLVAFIDGHVRYVKIYWDSTQETRTFNYNPPADYDYQWSAN